MGDIGDGPVAPKRTFYRTMVLRDILRRARKHHGAPLSPEDWAAVWELNDTRCVVPALIRPDESQLCGKDFAGQACVC